MEQPFPSLKHGPTSFYLTLRSFTTDHMRAIISWIDSSVGALDLLSDTIALLTDLTRSLIVAEGSTVDGDIQGAAVLWKALHDPSLQKADAQRRGNNMIYLPSLISSWYIPNTDTPMGFGP